MVALAISRVYDCYGFFPQFFHLWKFYYILKQVKVFYADYSNPQKNLMYYYVYSSYKDA